MKKEIRYRYLGTNGVIDSPIHLEDIYYIRRVKLTADFGKVLTKDGGETTFPFVTVPEEEVPLWEEIDKPGQV